MYAGTIFEIIDKSYIPPLPIAELPYKALFYCAAPTPKGPEKIGVYEGEDFYKTFGKDISFAKYGQPQLQAARIINAGGRVMFKRIVAEDAQLANNTVVARVFKERSQKLNSASKKLYIDANTGAETLVATGNTPIIYDKVRIHFELHSYSAQKEVEREYTVYEGVKYIKVGDSAIPVSKWDKGIMTTTDLEETDLIDQVIAAIEAGELFWLKETITVPDNTYDEEVTTPVDTGAGVSGTTVNQTITKLAAYDIDDVSRIGFAENSTYTSSKDFDVEGVTFPLFTITDIGRGISNKRWRIVPDYLSSRSKEIMEYRLQVIEDDDVIENFSFSLDPDTIDPFTGFYKDLRTQISGKSKQIDIKYYPEAITALYETIHDLIATDDNLQMINAERAAQSTPYKVLAPLTEFPYSTEELKKVDILFATTRKAENIPFIVFNPDDSTRVDLADQYGLTLDKGANGIFGQKPTDHPDELLAQYELAFTGTAERNSEIYDLMTYPIDIIADANYPDSIKRKIEELVEFREDCVAFIDMGTELSTLDEILMYSNKNAQNRYTYTTFVAYDIIDPYTNRQIRVTAMYDLVAKLCNHFAGGRSRAFAGLKHNVTLDSAIEGTVNFYPKKVPSINQYEILDDARINYASWLNGRLVMETEYSTNPIYTQLSYINNTFNLQDLIKTIRQRCPIIRYNFMDREGLKAYEEDINEIIDTFSSKFMTIEFKYMADKVYEQNHIYYAGIEVRFKNFVQTEWFKITALPSDQ